MERYQNDSSSSSPLSPMAERKPSTKMKPGSGVILRMILLVPVVYDPWVLCMQNVKRKGE